MSERQSKSTQDKHERILNELAKKPGNDLCADCGTKSKQQRHNICLIVNLFLSRSSLGLLFAWCLPLYSLCWYSSKNGDSYF